MRYQEILEAANYRSLMGRVSIEVEKSIEEFIKALINDFERRGHFARREQLGYHPYINGDKPGDRISKEHKPFNKNEYDSANKGWDVYSDYIVNEIDNLIPPVESGSKPSPVYALMNVISKKLTQITQEYVRDQYADETDSVTVCNKTSRQQIRQIKDIEVSVWWTGAANAKGTYQCDMHHTNGNKTRLNIKVDRVIWTRWLRNEIINIASYEKNDYDKFVSSIKYFHLFHIF